MGAALRQELLDYVTCACANEPGIPQEDSAAAWYPINAPLPGLCVGFLTPLGCALAYTLARRLEEPQDRTYIYTPSYQDQQEESHLIMSTMDAMELIAHGMVPTWLANVEAKIVLQKLVDMIGRSLLALQRAGRFTRFCVICRDQVIYAPRICTQSLICAVAFIPYAAAVGDKWLHTMILPPMEADDPPTLCQVHHDKFADLLYRVVACRPKHVHMNCEICQIESSRTQAAIAMSGTMAVRVGMYGPCGSSRLRVTRSGSK